MNDADLTLRRKIRAVKKVAEFRPVLTIIIIAVGLVSAILAGVGLSFILPIVEIAQNPSSPGNNAGGILAVFVFVYETIGVPFTLESVIIGVGLVMIFRYVIGFTNIWLRATLNQSYVRHLQTQAFKNALGAKVAYFDQEGSDDILNAIVTQAVQAGRAIETGVQLIEKTFLAITFATIAVVIAPRLTLIAAIVLGSTLVLFRYTVESGYSVGDRVAEANERIQESVQAGTQGIREVKSYGLTNELFDDFRAALNTYVSDSIKIARNQGALNQFYQLAAAIVLFSIIYLSLTVASLSLASLGLFLFVMFRLAPIISTLNDRFYKFEGNLPHLIRTQDFIEQLKSQKEPDTGTEPIPSHIDHIEFANVDFAYDQDLVLRNLSFEIKRGEFIAFVGQSGAGKSTIASLLARMYEPDNGEIRANGIPIDRFDIDQWRLKVAYVRQDHFIFNESLKYNLTIGVENVSEERLDKVCEIARIDEFLEDFPNGYDTVLGDNGVQLSGGQRQRVAIGRALLKDAELLVLDEATSDLDSNLEEDIQRAVESMKGEYMMITIAHRLSTVMNADRIYTMKDGQIVEVGDHDELVRESGAYANLYQTQTQQSQL